MLRVPDLRTSEHTIVAGLTARGLADAASLVATVLALDDQRRDTIQVLEAAQQQLNQTSKVIGQAMQAGETEKAELLKAKAHELKETLKRNEALLATCEQQLQTELLKLPNVPLPDVPVGRDAEANQVLGTFGTPPTLPPNPKPHWELAAALGLIDFELGVKITGAGFPVYVGQGARLQRALIQFFLDKATEAGYQEIQPPLLVNAESGFGTGQLPDKEGQMYEVPADGFFLIPTAEVPLTNLYRDRIVEEAALPVRMCGYTPCFRREAGSYGAHVRGLNRLHQFDKVEIVEICRPEDSAERLEAMLTHATGLLAALGLHYRTLLLCTGDLGFASAKTIDLEVWSPGQDRWLEVSSVSRFETFQSERLKLRYKPAGAKKTELLHTLNGSALALPRIVAALLEMGQQADGTIRLPAVLTPYMGTDTLG